MHILALLAIHKCIRLYWTFGKPLDIRVVLHFDRERELLLFNEKCRDLEK